MEISMCNLIYLFFENRSCESQIIYFNLQYNIELMISTLYPDPAVCNFPI